jgi:hypothetical protein
MNAIFHFETMDASKYIITSERTSDTFQSGKDNEVKLRYWASFFLVLVAGFLVELFTGRKWLRYIAFSVIALLLLLGVIAADSYLRTRDTEIWSGSIVGWDHKEEWEEWISGKKSCSTDDDGSKTCTTTRGHYEHHDAENKIKTSDDGWISVDTSIDGSTDFNDKYPNSTMQLAAHFPLGTPTASKHTYVNKVKAVSYSLFQHNNINLDHYPDLPRYPDHVNNGMKVDRIVGDVPNKEQALNRLAQWNTELNKSIPDPDHPGQTRSWKQVNLIFVNLGR